MTFFGERIRARDAAVRLYGMLREVRGAPKDARDFLVFDKSEDWKDLGVGADYIAAVDLTDDQALEKHIADAGAMARALGQVDDNDAISGGKGDDVLAGGMGDDRLADARLQPGNGVESREDLRREQAIFKAAARAPAPATRQGGFYADMGLGLGPGFNVHFDREGPTASVGAGVFGTAKLGYAPDLQALRDRRQNDRVFGAAEIKVGKHRVGAGAEVRYKTKPQGLAFDGATGSVGPLQGVVDPNLRPAIDIPFEAGFEGGLGVLKALSTRRWKR